MRLERAAERHRLAQTNCAKALKAFNSGLTVSPDGSQAIKRATLEENAAREEHMKILKEFTDLILRGKIPKAE